MARLAINVELNHIEPYLQIVKNEKVRDPLWDIGVGSNS